MHPFIVHVIVIAGLATGFAVIVYRLLQHVVAALPF